jgi:hypothetical protein
MNANATEGWVVPDSTRGNQAATHVNIPVISHASGKDGQLLN